MLRSRHSIVPGLVAVIIGLALAAPSALAGKRIYWSNYGGAKISFANVDDGSGGDLNVTGGAIDGPWGTSFDLKRNRLIWGNYNDGNRVGFAGLDDGGGGDLNTVGSIGPPTGGYATGQSVDPIADRVYWANELQDKISYTNLDGSGGGDLETGTAFTGCPVATAVDPPSKMIYWTTCDAPESISYARLDGSGGGDFDTTGATVSNPYGIALDPTTGRLFWSNTAGNKISYLYLDGHAPAVDIDTGAATVSSPTGLAIDVEARRVYWGNSGVSGISYANLDGGGGGNLPTGAATLSSPAFPVLLDAPKAAGAPNIAGGALRGSTLSCSATWAPDQVSSLLYRSPTTVTYQWSRDGSAIAGATTNSITADAPGDYRCIVTGTNSAGTASQTSAAHKVSLPSFGPRTLVTLGLAATRIPARGPVKVRVRNDNTFVVTGRLSGQTASKVNVSKRRRVKLPAKSFSVGAKARQSVSLRLPKSLRRVLKRSGKLKLRLSAVVQDPAHSKRTVSRRATVKLKKKKRR